MKPVTEDQVQSLLQGLEKREKEALKALDRDAKTTRTATGRMTANVFRLRSTPRQSGPVHEAAVVDFDDKRAERRQRITSKGFFFYATETRALNTN